MNKLQQSMFGIFRGPLALLCTILLLLNGTIVYAQAPQAESPKIPNDQLDSLVAPIALHPDPLLAQMLAASTYPLEIMQLQQWLATHKDLKDKALVDAVKKEDWDPSVQAMAALPEAVKQLSENIKWTTELGNAFLAQQSDVMDAVQRMRVKAQSAGVLKSSEQQKVETKVVESKTVVVIEQANPQVVYVPTYNPVVVYGPPVYPYPPIYYPPVSTGAVIATAAISFGVGMAMGAAWGGGWGYNAGWGNNDINVNVNNNFNRNTNINRNTNVSNRANVGSNNSWQHNSQHRGGAPYSNQATANRYGGTARAASGETRQTNARQNGGGGQQQLGSGSRGGASNTQAGSMNRSGASDRQASSIDRGGSSRQQPSTANRGGGDQIGNRSVSGGSSSRSSGGAFSGGGSGGYSGSSARANSSRGSSSMGSRGGGGGGRGGGRRR